MLTRFEPWAPTHLVSSDVNNPEKIFVWQYLKRIVYKLRMGGYYQLSISIVQIYPEQHFDVVLVWTQKKKNTINIPYSGAQNITVEEDSDQRCQQVSMKIILRRNSIANALELRLSCTNASIWFHQVKSIAVSSYYKL